MFLYIDHWSGIIDPLIFKQQEGALMAIQQGFADIEIINKLLAEYSAKNIADGSDISLSTVRKLKSGERLVEKMNLLDAIRLTQYAKSLGNKPIIEVYTSKLKE